MFSFWRVAIRTWTVFKLKCQHLIPPFFTWQLKDFYCFSYRKIPILRLCELVHEYALVCMEYSSRCHVCPVSPILCMYALAYAWELVGVCLCSRWACVRLCAFNWHCPCVGQRVFVGGAGWRGKGGVRSLCL